ncbi:MAG TPA: pyridine nucleotide-disulfide oxidoreductase, partial [Sphaerochaeta sp.]|nr:pyridine nucleotide-disulfide oxidoreductase [Sphaerochaeta sp.]
NGVVESVASASQAVESVAAASETVAEVVTSASQVVVESVAAASEVVAEVVASASQTPVVETVSAASGAVVDAVAAASQSVQQFAPPLLSQPLGIYNWINDTFVAQAPYLFQIVIVLAEVGIGLALIAGLFTFPAAVVSIGLSLMFIMGALAGKESLWYIAVSIVMLGGAGRAFGLDYWVMPWLKKQWNKTPFAKKTYLYLGEPEFTRKQMERRMKDQ